LDHRIIARGVLALLCTCQGVATLAIDLNRTHATNPEWPGHARFHLVWQTVSTSLLCALEVALVWWRGPNAELRFYLAAVLTCIPLLAFLAALVSRKMYGGALSDPNGIPPARVPIFGKTFHIDLNLVAVVAGLLVLAATLEIYRW
jgi:hypothetical protein